MKRLASFLLLAGALTGCPDPSPNPPAQLWTTANFHDEAAGHELDGDIAADTLLSFAGAPIALRSPPYTDAVTMQAPTQDGLNVLPLFVEGQSAACVPTEVWFNRTPIWVQPLYVPVTEYDPSAPLAHRLPGSAGIFGVGASSPFYSPFWRVEYVVVPASTPPDAIRSVKDVLDPGYERHYGPLRVCGIIPSGLGIAAPEGGAPQRPLNGDPIGTGKVGQAWADGVRISYLDWGVERFTVHNYDLVDETPRFVLSGRDASGKLTDLGVPDVGGVGPVRSGAVADAPAGVPRFGSLWRLHRVAVPRTAAVFLMPGDAALRAQFKADGRLQVPDVAPELASDPRAPSYRLRVALDSRCFADAAQFPDGCTWLDSQARIESLLPTTAVQATQTTTTCTLLEYAGQPVPFR